VIKGGSLPGSVARDLQLLFENVTLDLMTI